MSITVTLKHQGDQPTASTPPFDTVMYADYPAVGDRVQDNPGTVWMVRRREWEDNQGITLYVSPT